ncbi:phage tail tape measure protein [Pseudogulbenkiania sp. MAI-1]|uniref:phage tail tape measure protein n=1 Tax=Pseudogulbenkiania sp. MAI-1 TaxID=990370 RepID=UPI00045E8023|nr:phage tail tape measure protein [Pseudogulbenkiania sp. MAI-1]
MSNDLSLSVRIYADAARYAAGLATGVRETSKFAASVKRELESVKGFMGGLHGQLTTLAGGITALKVAADSANLDKSLTGIRLTAEATREEANALRQDMFRMAKDSGRSVEDLKEGFNNLVQAGQSWKAAREEIDATNVAMAVTNAKADKLTGALGVASESFHFDLAQPGKALQLLDKMTVAGRKGNAELENLSDIFARVGPSASSAGMGFDKTLAFIEGLSMMERQPERLATLADSTLRLFNNLNYMKDAAKATGVKFFNGDGSRRDALAVIADIKKQYDQITTDKGRATFLQKAFGKADLDTIKGMKILLSGNTLDKINQFSGEIGGAGGTLKRDMGSAIDNAVDQTGRLKAALREAADNFAQPINDTLAQVIKWGMDSKDNGGLALNGKDMVGGALALTAGTALAARYGSKLVSSLAGKAGSTAVGVATGKALEQAAGVTPVFVVNMPNGGPGGGGAIDAAAGAGAAGIAGKVASKWKVGTAMAGGLPLKDFLKLGVAAVSTAAAATTASAAAGYGVGTLAYKGMEGTKAGDFLVDKVGGGIARVLAMFGNEDARRAVEMTEKLKNTDLGGTLTIKLDTSGVAGVVSAEVQAKPNDSRLKYNVGKTMQGAN